MMHALEDAGWTYVFRSGPPGKLGVYGSGARMCVAALTCSHSGQDS